jgi:galactose-1-phosphate uridylyltransferase
MSYAPLGLAGDVLGVVDGVGSTLELNEENLMDLARGVARFLAVYDQMGIYSFNLNFFPGAPGDPTARFHVLLSPRAFFNQALATPDAAALRFLFNEPACLEFPEKIAHRLREGI